MFTLIAYSEINPTTAAAYTAVAAVPDQSMRIDDDIVYIASLNEILAAAVLSGEAITGAYLSSPSLRRVALYDILPIGVADTPVVGHCLVDQVFSPVPLETNEGLELYAESNVAVPADNCMGGVWLSDGPIIQAIGEIFHVRATATIVELDSTWVNTEIDFRQTLPVGRYQIVGARAEIADGVFFRFVPIGEAHRPGGFILPGKSGEPWPKQRNGGLGVWCEFDQITPPSVDVMGNVDAAGTDLIMVIDLIKIA